MSQVTPTSRLTASRDRLAWELLFVRYLGGAPLFIDWSACVHPDETPKGLAELMPLAEPMSLL